MLHQSAEVLGDRLHNPDSSPGPSPSLSHRSVASTGSLDLDLTLHTAVSHLVDHLLQGISRIYPSKAISALRLRLTALLSASYASSWIMERAQNGSGKRSLICTREHGLPSILREAAKEVGVEEAAWIQALARPVITDDETESRRRPDEWEIWCDPGSIICRYGGWEWEDIGYEPIKVVKEPSIVIWRATSSPSLAPATTIRSVEARNTPVRPSHAIPIRTPIPLPAVFAIPPTPANNGSSMVPNQPRAPSPSLLPAVSISRSPSPSHSELSSGYESSFSTGQNHSRASSNPSSVSSAIPKPPSRASHRGSGSGSTSSTASSTSDNSGVSQLLTPDSRPPSADMFSAMAKSITPTGPHRGRTPSPSSTPRDSMTPSTAASATPTVTPYDGGNVTVLGGGVKLGGGSRASSVISSNRTPIDRSRSPSISLASRALTSAMGPNGSRKTRTRRRIMPTYLGHLGQPGVGGPITGAFGGIYGSYSQPSSPWTGVGVGMGPPPASGVGRLGQPRVSSA